MENKFIRHYKEHDLGWYTEEQLKAHGLWDDVMRMAENGDKRLGYFVYHLYTKREGSICLEEMRIGYYIRGFHILPRFWWKMRRVHTC